MELVGKVYSAKEARAEATRRRILAVFLVGAVGTLTYGQQRTMTVGDIPAAVSTKAFTSTPVLPLKKGDTQPANIVIGDSGTSGWAVRVHEFVIGGLIVKYPIFGLVNCNGSDASDYCPVVASTTVITTDLRAGEELRSGGYLLQATRVVKTGEAVPTLLFIGNKGQSIISIEVPPEITKTKGKGDAAKPQPWLTIFDERLKPGDRALVLEAWRASNKTVATLLAVPGMTSSE